MKRFYILLSLLAALSGLQAATSTERVYYTDTAKYTISSFFNALDLPSVFGVGFTPGQKESFNYYSSLYLEWRRYKTYGWLAIAGIDTHNHNYRDIEINQCNVLSGERFSMDLMLGTGYRIPLVRDIREYYQRPYQNAWDIAFYLQGGASASHLKEVVPVDATDKYTLDNKWYFFPVMKFSTSLEWFTSPRFCIFALAGYQQQLIRQPWDKDGMIGVMSFSVGFAGFFN